MITSLKDFKTQIVKEHIGDVRWHDWYNMEIAPAKGDINHYIFKIKKKVHDFDKNLIATHNWDKDILQLRDVLAGIVEEVPVMENVTSNSKLIDFDKLTKWAEGIYNMCADYGNVYYNDDTNYIAVVLGDHHIFDEKRLADDLQYGVAKNYKDGDQITVEIDCEWVPKDCKYMYGDKGWREVKK